MEAVQQLQSPDGRKLCCQDKNNLILIEKHDDDEVWRCSVCQCRHFETVVQAVEFTTTVV